LKKRVNAGLSRSLRIAILVVALFLIFAPLYSALSQARHSSDVLISYSSASGAASSNQKVVVIQLYEEIDQGSASMMTRGIQEAAAINAQAIVIDMNTPGGLVSDMQTIISDINSSKIPVYTFVGTGASAASAGSYIAMSTDKIFMSSIGTVIGPSTPFVVGGSSSEQQHIQNYYTAYMVALAEAHGRNVTAVTEMAANNTAFTGVQAIKYHVADNESSSLAATLSMIHASGDSIVTVSENPSEQLLTFLSANSVLDGIFITIGITAIVLDFLHPTILLTIGGVVLIILGLIGEEAIQGPNGLQGIFLPITLFIVAAILVVFEIKTGHGFLLFSGIVIGAIGAILFAYQVPYVSPNPYSGLEIIEIGLLVVVGAILGLYARYIGSSLRRKPVTGQESLIGSKATVYSETLGPEGEVSVNGVIWRARLQDPKASQAKKGDRVTVTKVEGLTLIVVPASA
jgi:membrane-bound serine protease (ClpP class)